MLLYENDLDKLSEQELQKYFLPNTWALITSSETPEMERTAKSICEALMQKQYPDISYSFSLNAETQYDADGNVDYGSCNYVDKIIRVNGLKDRAGPDILFTLQHELRHSKQHEVINDYCSNPDMSSPDIERFMIAKMFYEYDKENRLYENNYLEIDANITAVNKIADVIHNADNPSDIEATIRVLKNHTDDLKKFTQEQGRLYGKYLYETKKNNSIRKLFNKSSYIFKLYPKDINKELLLYLKEKHKQCVSDTEKEIQCAVKGSKASVKYGYRKKKELVNRCLDITDVEKDELKNHEAISLTGDLGKGIFIEDLCKNKNEVYIIDTDNYLIYVPKTSTDILNEIKTYEKENRDYDFEEKFDKEYCLNDINIDNKINELSKVEAINIKGNIKTDRFNNHNEIGDG